MRSADGYPPLPPLLPARPNSPPVPPLPPAPPGIPGAPEDVLEWFPDDLIEEHDGWVESNSDTDQLFLPADAGDAIAADLRSRDHRVERTDTGDLADWLHYSYMGY